MGTMTLKTDFQTLDLLGANHWACWWDSYKRWSSILSSNLPHSIYSCGDTAVKPNVSPQKLRKSWLCQEVISGSGKQHVWEKNFFSSQDQPCLASNRDYLYNVVMVTKSSRTLSATTQQSKKKTGEACWPEFPLAAFLTCCSGIKLLWDI